MKEHNTVFDVTVVLDHNWKRPHYPSYKIKTEHVGLSSSFDGAKKLISDFLGLECYDNIHHFNIREIPLDYISYTDECLSEWLYDRKGKLLDKRLFSNMRNEPGMFTGRTQDEIRFKVGDIVEVQRGNEIYLGFVVALPPSVERAAKVNATTFFNMDDTDDAYTILTEEDYRFHDHVSSLMVFQPAFKIHPFVEKRLRTAYQNYLTLEMRERIAMTTALERIRQTVTDLGMDCDIEPYYLDYILVTHRDHPEKGKTTVIRIAAEKAFNHIDRVLLTLQRYAGRPLPGGRRGYSLRFSGALLSKEEQVYDMG